VLPELKVAIPELEPDPVLLEQLSQLSAASWAPQAGGGPVRSLVATGTVVVVGGLSWLTGTLPGVASPFHHDPAPRHAPAEPGQGDDDGSVLPSAPPSVPPGQTGAHPDRGLHNGQVTPGQAETDDNGNHYGQTKPHQNNGNHTGQTKPHQNSGNHTGQTKPHENKGNHTGQTNPDEDEIETDQSNGNGSGNGGGNANGHVK